MAVIRSAATLLSNRFLSRDGRIDEIVQHQRRHLFASPSRAAGAANESCRARHRFDDANKAREVRVIAANNTETDPSARIAPRPKVTSLARARRRSG